MTPSALRYTAALQRQKLQRDAATGDYLTAIQRAILLIRLEDQARMASIDDYGAAASFRQDNQPQIARTAK